MANLGDNPVEEPGEEIPDRIEPESLSPKQIEDRKIDALSAVAKKMTMNAIPYDRHNGHEEDIEPEVFAAVDRYFSSNRGNLIQYFADTKNTVTTAIKEELENDDVLAGTNFVDVVVDRVTNDEDIDTVIQKIKTEIQDTAAEDIQEITDNIKDEPEDDHTGENGEQQAAPMTEPIPSSDTNPLQESIFHHYLIECYKDTEVPDDPNQMLLRPMVETAFHYVRRVLFNDGWGNKMNEGLFGGAKRSVAQSASSKAASNKKETDAMFAQLKDTNNKMDKSIDSSEKLLKELGYGSELNKLKAKHGRT
jgi:hypothetical protein